MATGRPWRVTKMPLNKLQDWLNDQHPSIQLKNISPMRDGDVVVVWVKQQGGTP